MVQFINDCFFMILACPGIDISRDVYAILPRNKQQSIYQYIVEQAIAGKPIDCNVVKRIIL